MVEKLTPKERPILFSAPMVRALLDGSKTQTRRTLRVQPFDGVYYQGDVCFDGFRTIFDSRDVPPAKFSVEAVGGGAYLDEEFHCPQGQPGDRLWVRETHRPIFGQTCGLIAVDYLADPREKWERLGDAPDSLVKPTKWIPSIHMRREYSRIMLEVVSIRVERLNDCSEADARAEGCTHYEPANHLSHGGWSHDGHYVHETALASFEKLWESINGAGSWAANPWVWVVEFKRVTL